MANKSASVLNRPVPDLSRTISKIMNVVWVEPSAKKDGKNARTITYTIYNYTTQERTLRLHAQLPKECVNLTLFTNPNFIDMNDEGKATWEIVSIRPSTQLVISFELKGELADTFDIDDVYISGINPVFVMGADALPGDWGIKGLEVTEANDSIPTEEEEEIEEVEDLGDE